MKNNTVSRQEIINNLTLSGVPQTLTKKIIETVIDEIIEGLKKDKKAVIHGFGTFVLKKCPPRKSRNPKTGQNLIAKSKNKVYFKLSREFKKKLNSEING